MITHAWLRIRRFGTATLTTGHRRDRGRRLRRSALGLGLQRLEGLEDRTLLATITTLAAANVTTTGATLNGTVNPEGTSTDTSFQYSTNSGLAPNVVTTLAGTAGTTGSTDGTGSAASFDAPQGIAVDPTTGDIYVADTTNDTIRMITPAGVVTTLAGTAGTAGSTDGTGSAASFNAPQGIAVDPTTGDIYVADTTNDTIRMVTPAGVVTTLAGTAGTAGSTDGTGSAASFNAPQGIAVDPTSGNIYVADTGNDTIRMVTPAGVVTTLAGTAGTAGSTDGTGSAASFNGPQGLAVNSAGNIYVADTGNDTIRMVTPAGVVTTLAGTAGTTGSADGTGTAASFNGPQGLAVDPNTGNIYVADTGNDTIRMVTPAGVVTTLAGTAGTAGSTDGTGSAASFNAPQDLAVNSTGNVYVADTGNDTIRQLSPLTVTAQTGLTGTTAESISAPLTGLTPNTTYYFRAAATSSGGSATGAIMSFTTTTAAAVAPTATTQAATAVAGTTATLNGSVNPEGSATTAQFIYGTDSTLTTGTTTIPIPALMIGTGTADVPVLEPLTGLTPNTTYYYEVQATNSVGTTTGAIMSFATTTQTVTTPTITVGQATNVTTTGATVNATVNPNGVATTVQFVYGTQPNLASGTSTTAEQSIGSGTTAVPVTASLTGLQPGTTYYYQAVATSNGVATPGPIGSFTTTAAAAGPMVTNLQRYGYHGQPTKFVLTFNEPLNPTTAQDLNNYQISPLTGAGAGNPIALSSAVYNSSNNTVTLSTVSPVYLYGSYQLTVNGTSPSGLSSTTGQFLQGQGTGKPGTNYVTTFGESILAGPDITASMSRATRARILRTWKHDEAMAARIAARMARTAERRAQAVKTVHHVTTATPAGAGEHAAAVDAVLGSITVFPTSHRSRR